MGLENSNSDSENYGQEPRTNVSYISCSEAEAEERGPRINSTSVSCPEDKSCEEPESNVTFVCSVDEIEINCLPCFRAMTTCLILGSLLMLVMVCLEHEKHAHVLGENTFLSNFSDSYMKPCFDKFQNITAEIFSESSYMKLGFDKFRNITEGFFSESSYMSSAVVSGTELR